MRRAVPLLLAAAVVAILVIGLNQASGPSSSKDALPPFDLRKALAKLDGAPAPLAELHQQHDALLGGGTKAYRARLKALRGHPVVVNKWASWCGPCKAEFPVFQRVSADVGRRVAFVGINFTDNTGDARRFMRQRPLTFPSYLDPHGALSQAAGIPGGAPITLFIDRRGKTAFVHQGQYRTTAELRTDIRRYLRA